MSVRRSAKASLPLAPPGLHVTQITYSFMGLGLVQGYFPIMGNLRETNMENERETGPK